MVSMRDIRKGPPLDSERQRTMLLHVAETWMRLAEQLTEHLPSTRLH
jgi:hypothetical protein